MPSITSVCAGEEKGGFPHVAGELGRGLEFGAGLGQSAGPKQKVAPRRRQWRIIAQGGGVGNLVYQPQAHFGPECHAVGDRSIEIDHWRGHHCSQPVVERCDAGPVGIGRTARTRMTGCKRGLQRIGAIAPESFGAGQRLKASADQQLVPACAILLGQRYKAHRPARCAP